MAVPDWAKTLRKKGQIIKKEGTNLYLYEVSYKYDPAKKRSRTIPGRYLGRLDEKKGLIPASARKAVRKPEYTAPLEYGASELLESLGSDMREKLIECFGKDDGDAIMAIGKIGLIDKEPEKRIHAVYETSYEKIRHPDLSLSGSSISRLTERIGKDRKSQMAFMKAFIGDATHVIFDGTRLVCYSKDISDAQIGYNHSGIKDPQINLMYCFSLKPVKMPVYFMPFPGNRPDIANIRTSLKELNIRDAYLIADKGFACESNLTAIRRCGMTALWPIRRDSSLIDYSFLEGRSLVAAFGSSFFAYHGRTVYYKVMQEYEEAEEPEKRKRGRPKKDEEPPMKKVLKEQIVLYVDSRLYEDEMDTYTMGINLRRDGFTPEGLVSSEKYFGTIALAIDKKEDPIAQFTMYKERELIEDGNKAYKHVLDDFASNKQCTDTYNGWLFLNHISLMLYYRVFNKIKEKRKTDEISVEDVMDTLKRVTIFKADEEWVRKEPTLKELKSITEIFK